MNGEKVFELEERWDQKGEKVVPLVEAVHRCIHPGMAIHTCTGAYPNAILREIIRQFLGKNPNFTFISSGVATPYEIALVCSGLAKKVITTNHSYTYPAPKPIPLLQKLNSNGQVKIEMWSTYTLEQRLLAAALGVGFMPTKSLIGSDVAKENPESYSMITNPFDKSSHFGVVKALAPDISLIHGCVADTEGNTILAPPYFASIWGPLASRNGVIVSVEKIVPKDFIRKYAPLVTLPGEYVRYVCEVPYGSHPQGIAGEVVGINGYGEDYEFLSDFVSTTQNEEGLKQWIEQWVFSQPTQNDYLKKLGLKKIILLKGKSTPDTWKYEHITSLSNTELKETYNSLEMMIIAAARELVNLIKQKGYQRILVGIGRSALAAWTAFYLLKQEGIKITLVSGLGHVGYEPRPGDPYLMTLSNVMTSTALTDTTRVYGVLVGGKDAKCLSVLGAAQIDKFGNTNTVKINDKSFIGLGGSADALNSAETMVLARQSRNRFLEKVPYIGCPGDKVSTLVTDLGIFKKIGSEKSFTLVAYFQKSFFSHDNCISEIQKTCGWKINAIDNLEEIFPPTEEELYILRSLDPKGIYRGKKSKR